MKFEKKEAEKYLLFAIEGDVRSEECLVELEEQIKESLEKSNQNIIFDLKSIKFMNSDGLNFMVRVLTALRAKDGELYLTNLPEKFTNLMLITKLNSIFAIYRSNEEAIDQIHFLEAASEDANEEE